MMPLFLLLSVRPRASRVVARSALGLLAVWAALTLCLLALEDRLLFRPAWSENRWIDPPPDVAFEDVYLELADNTAVHARWYPCRDARGAVLICHGRAGNLSLVLPPKAVAAWHREVGVSVLVFDYP